MGLACVYCGAPVPPRRHAYCSRACNRMVLVHGLRPDFAPKIESVGAQPRLCACGAPAVPSRGSRGPVPTRCEDCWHKHRTASKARAARARREAQRAA